MSMVNAERDMPREIKYTLSTGQFRGQMNMGTDKGPFRYHFRWVLSLDRPPYPEATVLPFGPLPTSAPYNYFGHPVPEQGMG
jgi:hypothetical protein